MKKYLILFMAVVSTSFFVGCDSDDEFTPPNYVTFANQEMNISVDQNSSASIDVTVFTANTTGSDRTFPIIVSANSTLDAAAYNVPANVTIPANSNETTFTVEVNDTNISNEGESLILTLEGAAELYTGDSLVISVVRNCPSDLEGTYAVLSDGSSTDGAPANNPVEDFPYQVDIVETADKTYSISDGFAGLYIEWYCDAYGYCFETPGTFTDVCGNLSGSWEDGFESNVTLTGTVNDDGTLTITWVNGFGDTATATYTKM